MVNGLLQAFVFLLSYLCFLFVSFMGWGFQGSDMVTPVDHGRGWSGGVKDEPSSKHPCLWLELAKIGPFERDVIQGTGPLSGSHAGSSTAKAVAERSRSETFDSGIEQKNTLDITIELARFGPVDGIYTDVGGAEIAEEMSPQGSCMECLPQVTSLELALVGSLEKHPNDDICAWAPSYEGSQENCGLEMVSL